MVNVLILSTIFLPWLGAAAVWLVRDRNSRLLHILATGFSLAAAAAALAILPLLSEHATFNLPLSAQNSTSSVWGSLTFIPDAMGVLLTIIATVIGSLAIIFSINYMHGEAQLGRYYSLILIFIGAMSGLVLTGSLLFLFFFWEITALCSYALISFYNDDPKAVAGGIKALIITQLGGAGLLVGALAIAAQTGSFNLETFLSSVSTFSPTLLGWIAFGFLFASAAKSAQVPFQTWLPDAMEAPTPVSALIHAATMVNAGIYLLFRFYPAFEAVPGWKTAVMAVGMLTAFLAALMAAVAGDLKRVLAYSTVSQLGYMVFAIGVGGLFAAQFHLFSHAVFKALLFLGAGSVIHSVGTRQMDQMGGLGKEMPFVRNVFIIGALALAGIPILNGFWSKELILETGFTEGPRWAYLVMLAGSGITAYYTARMVWMVFFGEPAHPSRKVHDAQMAMRVALLPLAIGALTTWLLAGLLSKASADTLPFHGLHELTTLELAEEILLAPATWIAMAVIAAGFLTWVFRGKLTWLSKSFAWLAFAAKNSFGFEKINQFVVTLIQRSASLLRKTQTGQLNWNIAALISCLVIVLIIVIWGI
jgi:NADH-quinone oxidoreductase subunit L